MRRRDPICLLKSNAVAWAVGCVILALASPAAEAADHRPNVIFILADDLGYTDLACYGSGFYETPHVDRMASQGMRFTHGYSCGPNCQPTRAALISGQYGPRTGVYTVGSIERFNWRSRPLRPVDNVESLPLSKVTVAQTLRKAGYTTGYFGKWHLGEQGAYHPSQRGFDEALVSRGKHFDFLTNPEVSVPPGSYLADFLTDQAEGFIRRHRDEPFFLWLSHFAVHSPYEAKADLERRFQDKPVAGGHGDATYAAMIASLDESVGRIVSTLDDLQLSQRTLVIFSSDNGGVGGYRREGLRRSRNVTDNAPLRGGKGMLYEGGVRVPYIFRWPGRIAAGSVCQEPINSVDLYPTLLDLSAAEAPHDYPLDGSSYKSLLLGEAAAADARPDLFWHFPGYLGAGRDQWRTIPVSSVRSGAWKLMEFLEDGRRELYHLGEDQGETRDLSASRPELCEQLHARLVAWRQAIQAPMPQKVTAAETATEAEPRSE